MLPFDDWLLLLLLLFSKEAEGLIPVPGAGTAATTAGLSDILAKTDEPLVSVDLRPFDDDVDEEEADEEERDAGEAFADLFIESAVESPLVSGCCCCCSSILCVSLFICCVPTIE